MNRMLYGPLAAFAASPRAGPSAADAMPLPNTGVPKVAARVPAPIVFRTFLRPMSTSDCFALAILVPLPFSSEFPVIGRQSGRSVQDLDAGVDTLDDRVSALAELLARPRRERPRHPHVELPVEAGAAMIRLDLTAHLVGTLGPDR